VEKPKVLALLSGGLDSTLAVAIMRAQNVDVEAIHFTTPFCNCDACAVDAVQQQFNIPIHHQFLGQEFLNIVAKPPHGYGSQMNPCIDCRILMFTKAKAFAEKIGAMHIVTGEVVNQRPFSQRKHVMRLIEKESQLEGRVLRPLSAKLLSETELEKAGAIDRTSLHSIQGRRRISQIQLAKQHGIHDYPCPAGGCLLTDPQFAQRLKDFLTHCGTPTMSDIYLLKLGRHFRISQCRIIVGRNKMENHALVGFAQRRDLPYLEVSEYMGPITVLVGHFTESILRRAAELTVRYSDAPSDLVVHVECTGKNSHIVKAKAMSVEDIPRYRI
jgi:tRNA U34 2-thiouridine synthase MnmA/TrmU